LVFVNQFALHYEIFKFKEEGMSMVTIVDVATEAGVSVATVSRVLNNNVTVTKEKKELVLEAIKKTGYVIPARMKIANPSLAKATILVITNVLVETLIESIHSAAQDLGYYSITYCYKTLDDYDNLKALIDSIQPFLAGIILINAIDSSEAFQSLIAPYSVVQIGEPILDHQDNYTVYNYEILMAYDATTYLSKSGKKQIGLLTSEPNNVKLFSSHKREKGFYLALLDHKIEINYQNIIYTDVSIEGGYDATIKLLKQNPAIDAIVCICDPIALGCLHGLLSQSIASSVVQPLSLDYNEVWELFNPFLPYVDPQLEKMGYASVQLLNSLINKESMINYYRIVIPHELVLKPSRKDLNERILTDKMNG
jgi:DNA-binding LacI/PurR family transcriptional regulator